MNGLPTPAFDEAAALADETKWANNLPDRHEQCCSIAQTAFNAPDKLTSDTEAAALADADEWIKSLSD